MHILYMLPPLPATHACWCFVLYKYALYSEGEQELVGLEVRTGQGPWHLGTGVGPNTALWLIMNSFCYYCYIQLFFLHLSVHMAFALELQALHGPLN